MSSAAGNTSAKARSADTGGQRRAPSPPSSPASSSAPAPAKALAKGHAKVHPKGAGLVGGTAAAGAPSLIKQLHSSARTPAPAAAPAPAKRRVSIRLWLSAFVASMFGKKVIPLPGTRPVKSPAPSQARSPAAKAPAPSARGAAGAPAFAPTVPGPAALEAKLGRGGETTLSALASLKAVLDKHPRTRLVLKHLAVVEFSLAEQGLCSLRDAPPDIAATALDQLDIATNSEPDPALLVLRSMLAERACAPLSASEVSQAEATPPRPSKFGVASSGSKQTVAATAAASAARESLAAETARRNAVPSKGDDRPTGFLPTAPGNLEVSDATHSVFAALDEEWRHQIEARNGARNALDADRPVAFADTMPLSLSFADTMPSTFGELPPGLDPAAVSGARK